MPESSDTACLWPAWPSRLASLAEEPPVDKTVGGVAAPSAEAGPARVSPPPGRARIAPPPLPQIGRRGANRHQLDRGPLGPPIGGGRWGHPVWVVASEDDASSWSVDGVRGLPTTGSDGPNNHRH
jgi:hypothetical protein|uniref:Uncharacterized protein n=1 Tax=Zea mays TaxID=4577 RepID=B6TY27_MAIZE|nr:hypothetical protein [Zea mays]